MNWEQDGGIKTNCNLLIGRFVGAGHLEFCPSPGPLAAVSRIAVSWDIYRSNHLWGDRLWGGGIGQQVARQVVFDEQCGLEEGYCWSWLVIAGGLGR